MRTPAGVGHRLDVATDVSDIIGRKPVILGGMLLAAVTYYPLYAWLGQVTQPGNINYPIAILIIVILVCYVGMVYGPVGAFLAEFSATAGAAAWCRSSPRRPSSLTFEQA
jgi:hypothetical protein